MRKNSNKQLAKNIGTVGVASLMVGAMTFTDLSVNVMAATVPLKTVSVQDVKQEDNTSILDKDFKRSQMTSSEKSTFDKVLEKSYKENQDVAKANHWSKREYKENMENILNGTMEVEETSDGKLQLYTEEVVFLENGKKAKKKKKHGWLSVGALGAAIDVILSIAVGSAGFGSVKAMVKAWGKEKAKRWIKRHVKQQIINKIKHIAGEKAAKMAGGVILKIVDVCVEFDPGVWIAQQIDKRDKIPSNGYIEIF